MGILMESAEVTLGTASPAGLRDFRGQIGLFGAMGTPGNFYPETVHSITINTRETEFGSIVEPIPIAIKTYKQFQNHEHPHISGYGFPTHPTISSLMTGPALPQFGPSDSVTSSSPAMVVKDASKITRAPPKKKWIREYLEEEPKSPVSLRVVSVAKSNGLVRVPSPPALPVSAAPPAPAQAPAPEPLPLPLALVTAAPPPPAPHQIVDFAQEHSRPRTASINSHGTLQTPSPPSAGSSSSNGGCSGGSSGGSNGSSGGSNGSNGAPRAGTREVHNKLEKNRRAHLKECFELLKRQLPATPDDKKTSNLSILGSAIRYIQVLRRKERECEHEMERLAREKIAAQQRLAGLKREVTSVRPLTPRARPLAAFTSSPACVPDTISDDKEMEDRVNGHVLGISIASSPPRSPPVSLNLSTQLRALPVQISPTAAQQAVRNSFSTRHSTLTLAAEPQTNGVVENGVTSALSTIVHPAQIIPISQGCGGGLVVNGATLQLLSTNLRLVHKQQPLQQHHQQQQLILQPHINGAAAGESSRIPRTENGVVSTVPVSTDGSVVVNGLTPLVVSPTLPTTAASAHLLHKHTLTHKMVETQMVKGAVSPLSVSAQYVSARLVKPVVVVSHTHT